MGLVCCGDKEVECQAVVFDKDGTIINSLQIWPDLIRCRRQALQRKLGFGPEVAERIERVMGLQADGRITLRSVIVIGSRPETAAAVNAVLYLQMGLPWDEGMATVLEAFEQADRDFPLSAQAVPVAEGLDTLRRLTAAGLQVAVATNDSIERTKSLMDLCGMSPFISAYACCDEVREGKPAPDILLLACERMGVRTEECVVVGDSLLDFAMADAAGRVGLKVGVLTGASTKADLDGKVDVILASIADIMCR